MMIMTIGIKIKINVFLLGTLSSTERIGPLPYICESKGTVTTVYESEGYPPMFDVWFKSRSGCHFI